MGDLYTKLKARADRHALFDEAPAASSASQRPARETCAARPRTAFAKPEAESAHYWAEQLAQATDAARRELCHFMMMAAVKAQLPGNEN